jgi:hypothetical protein
MHTQQLSMVPRHSYIRRASEIQKEGEANYCSAQLVVEGPTPVIKEEAPVQNTDVLEKTNTWSWTVLVKPAANCCSAEGSCQNRAVEHRSIKNEYPLVEAITRQEICGDVAGWKDFESTVVSCRL